jgi:hypothetical protein
MLPKRNFSPSFVHARPPHDRRSRLPDGRRHLRVLVLLWGEFAVSTSPLPWRLNEQWSLVDATGQYVCPFKHAMSDRDKANCFLIVTAVNSHAALLAAAKRAAEVIDVNLHNRLHYGEYACLRELHAAIAATIAWPPS